MLNSVGPLGLSTIDEEPDFQISTCIKNPTAAASDGLNQNSRKDCLRQMPMRPSADVKASKKHSTRVTERCRGHGSLRQVSVQGVGLRGSTRPTTTISSTIISSTTGRTLHDKTTVSSYIGSWFVCLSSNNIWWFDCQDNF